jgi:tetratricopeptide (TPR) repeat protein
MDGKDEEDRIEREMWTYQHRAITYLARGAVREGNFAEASEYLQMLRFQLQGDDWASHLLRLETKSLLGEIELSAGNHEKAEANLDWVLSRIENAEASYDDWKFETLLLKGILRLYAADFTKSLALITQANRLTEKHGALYEAIPMYYLLGVLNTALGEREQARHNLELALTIAGALERPDKALLFPGDIFYNIVGAAEPLKAIDLCAELVSKTVERGNVLGFSLLTLIMASYYVFVQATETGLDLLQRAKGVLEKVGQPKAVDLLQRFSTTLEGYIGK